MNKYIIDFMNLNSERSLEVGKLKKMNRGVCNMWKNLLLQIFRTKILDKVYE